MGSSHKYKIAYPQRDRKIYYMQTANSVLWVRVTNGEGQLATTVGTTIPTEAKKKVRWMKLAYGTIRSEGPTQQHAQSHARE